MTSKLKSPDIISTKSDRETNEGFYFDLCLGSRDRSESSQKSSQDGNMDDQGSFRKDKRVRIKHNEVERRRKDKINAYILRIGHLLTNKDPSKLKKTVIMENAVKYILESQRTQEKLLMGKCTEVQVTLIKSLRKKISNLEEKTKRYEKLLMTAGIPLNADPTTTWLSKSKTADSSQSSASTSAADTTQVTSSSKNDPPCSQIEATSTSGDLALVQEEATSSSKKKSKNTISSHLEFMKNKSKDATLISAVPPGLEVLQPGQILTSALPGRAVIHGTPGITTITVNPNIVGMATSPDSRTALNTATMIGSNAMVASNSNLLPLSQILNQTSVPVMMNQNSLIFLSPSATKVQNSTSLLAANNQLNVSSQAVLSNLTPPQTALPINQVVTKEPELQAITMNSPNIAKSSPSIGSTSGIMYNAGIQQEEIPPTANPSTTAVTQSLDGQPIMSTNQGNGIIHIPTGSSVGYIQGSHVGTHNQMQPVIFINEQGIPMIQTWPSPFMVTHGISQDNQSEGQTETQELSNDCGHMGMPVINIIPQSNSNLQSNNISDSQCQQSLKITQFNPAHQVTSSYLAQTSNPQIMTQHFLNHVHIPQDKQIQQLVDNQTPISLTINQAQQAQLQSHLTASGLAQQQQQQQRQLQHQLQQQFQQVHQLQQQQIQQQLQQQQIQQQLQQQQLQQQMQQQQVQQQMQQQAQQQMQQQAQQQQAKQMLHQSFQTSQVYIPTQQQPTTNTVAPSFSFTNQNCTEAIVANQSQSTPISHSQANQTSGNILGQAVPANQHGQYLTVNNNSSGGCNLPSALILPNGQIIPVVSQPNLLYSKSSPTNNSILVTSSSNSISQISTPVMSQAASLSATIQTNATSDATNNCEQINSQNEQQNDSLNSGLLTTVSLPETEKLEPTASQHASSIIMDTSSATTNKEFSPGLTTSVACQVNSSFEPAVSTSIVTIPSESIVTTTSTIQNSTTTTTTSQSSVPLTTPIMITIPPQSNNLTPIFTSSTTSDSCHKKPARKKTMQRAIKPKPVTSSTQSSQISQNMICTYPAIGSISSSSYSVPTTSTIYSNSNHLMSISASATDSKTQTDNQSINSGDDSTSTTTAESVASISNAFRSSSSTQPTEPLSIATDILAKATESIFSNSLSDPSPPISNFYNADPSDFGIPGTTGSVNIEQNQQQNNQSDYINFDHSSLLINSKNIGQEMNKNDNGLSIQNEQMNLNEVLKQVDALSEKAKSRKSKSGDASNEPTSKRSKKNQSDRRGSTSSGNRSRTNSASKDNSLQMHTMSMDSSGNIFLTVTSNNSQPSHNVTVNSISNISTNSDQLTKTSSGADNVLYNLTFSAVQTDSSTSGSQLLPQSSDNEDLNIANSYQMINHSQPLNSRRHSHPIVEGMKSHNMPSIRRSSNTPNEASISRASPINQQPMQHQGNLTSPIRDTVNSSQSSNMNNIISQALSMANVTSTNSSNCINTTQQSTQQLGQNLQVGHDNQQNINNSYCSQSAETSPIFTCMGTITYPGNNPNPNALLSPVPLQGDQTFSPQNSVHQAETIQIESNPNNVSKNVSVDTSNSHSQSTVQNTENRAISTSSRHANASTLRASCTTSLAENSNQGNARRGQATPEMVPSSHVNGVTLSHQSPGIEQQSPTVTGSLAVTNYSTEALLSDASIIKESQYVANQKASHGKDNSMAGNHKQNQLLTSPKSTGQNLGSQQKTQSTQGVSQTNRPGISYSTERLLQSPTNNKRPCNTRPSNAIIGTTCVNSQAIPSNNSCSIAATSSASNFLVNSIATTTARNMFSSTTTTSTSGNQSQHSFPFYTNHSIVIQDQQNNLSHQPSPQQQARNMFHHFPSQNRIIDHNQQGINVQNTNRTIRSNQIEVPPFSYTQPEGSQQNTQQQPNNEVFGNIFNFPSTRMGDDLLSPQGINQHKETANVHSSQNQMNSFIQHSNFHGPAQTDQAQHDSNNNHSNSFVRPPFDSSFIGNQQQTFQVMNTSNTFEQIPAIQHGTRNTSSEETTRKTMNVVDKSKTIQQSKQKSKKAQSHKKNSKQFQEESEVNLSTSIFEPSRSVTPYFPIPNLSPPRNDAPTYIPNNLFASPSRPGMNSAGSGKSSENSAPYNSLFAPRSHGGLSLNFQPGFGMKLHGNGGTSTQITSHSTSLTVTPHVPNFNLSNLFPDINTSGSDGINISPIKFHPGNPILPPPQPGIDPNPLQHHQSGTLYHNRPHPPVLHNAMSINSILGHNPHGFETRPPVSMGINSPMAPPFHGHGHNPSFSNVMPTLNFTMHEH